VADPPVFPWLARLGPVDEEEMFRVFNMGIGYVLIVKPPFADSVMRQLAKAGETPYVIGQVVRGKQTVRSSRRQESEFRSQEE